jgi:hypothetical protein
MLIVHVAARVLLSPGENCRIDTQKKNVSIASPRLAWKIENMSDSMW